MFKKQIKTYRKLRDLYGKVKYNTAISNVYRGRVRRFISGAVIESTNPASGQVWALIPRGQKEDVDRAFQAARQCFESQEWKSISPAQRGRLLTSS